MKSATGASRARWPFSRSRIESAEVSASSTSCVAMTSADDFAPRLKRAPEFAAGGVIHFRCRFIEHDQFGRAEKRLRRHRLAPSATRQIGEPLVELFDEAEFLRHRKNERCSAAEPAQVRAESEEFAQRDGEIEIALLRTVADLASLTHCARRRHAFHRTLPSLGWSRPQRPATMCSFRCRCRRSRQARRETIRN